MTKQKLGNIMIVVGMGTFLTVCFGAMFYVSWVGGLAALGLVVFAGGMVLREIKGDNQ